MIMDEPTAALGVREQRKVLQLVRALREAGVPVILVTHNMQDAFAVADRLLVMRRGRLVGEGSPSTTVRQQAGAGSHRGARLAGDPRGWAVLLDSTQGQQRCVLGVCDSGQACDGQALVTALRPKRA